MQPSLEVLINWFPMLMLIGVWIFFMRQMRGKDGITSGQYMAAILDEQKKQNELMSQTLDNMNRRLQRLEDADRAERART